MELSFIVLRGYDPDGTFKYILNNRFSGNFIIKIFCFLSLNCLFVYNIIPENGFLFTHLIA